MTQKKISTLQRKPQQPRRRYAICVSNEGYAASLEKRKIYQVMPDRPARARNLLRVVDESGEDYLYPADRFTAITLSPAVAKVLAFSA
jgi:hypothetical protein